LTKQSPLNKSELSEAFAAFTCYSRKALLDCFSHSLSHYRVDNYWLYP